MLYSISPLNSNWYFECYNSKHNAIGRAKELKKLFPNAKWAVVSNCPWMNSNKKQALGFYYKIILNKKYPTSVILKRLLEAKYEEWKSDNDIQVV